MATSTVVIPTFTSTTSSLPYNAAIDPVNDTIAYFNNAVAANQKISANDILNARGIPPTVAAGTIFRGPTTGPAAAPSFGSFSAADFGTIGQGLFLGGPLSGTGSAAFRAIGYADLPSVNSHTGGRLSYTTAVPFTTSDVVAAMTVYLVPVGSNLIALFNGSSWNIFTYTQISVGVPATTSTGFDVFAYNSGGAATLVTQNWGSSTARGYSLAYQDGVLSLGSDLTKRYIGSGCTTSASGQSEDSRSNRLLYNYNRRSRRFMYANEATATWSYATGTYRPADNHTTNSFKLFLGLSEDSFQANASLTVGGSFAGAGVGIGIDSTSSNTATTYDAVNFNGLTGPMRASYEGFLSVGLHTITLLEYGSAGATFHGTDSQILSGITGNIIM